MSKSRVNGEMRARARAHTAEMLFSFEEILAHASQDETIFAGEFFGSGTVGNCCGLEIGRFLEDGDVIELEVENIGVLKNKVERQELTSTDLRQGEDMYGATIDRHIRARCRMTSRPIRRGDGPAIDYVDYRRSVPAIVKFFPGLKGEDLPEGKGWAAENVRLSTHNGTHVDAPWHFHPTMNSRRAFGDHRRSAARMVSSARREARLPPLPRRLRRERCRCRGAS